MKKNRTDLLMNKIFSRETYPACGQTYNVVGDIRIQ